jgi:hypothetical protein
MLSHTASRSDAVARSYRQRAEQCLAEAEKTPSSTLKAEWKKMAGQWMKLAEAAES